MRVSKHDFLRLDARSSTFKRLGVGNKVAMLNHAVKSGLPVPNGIALMDAAWPRLIEDGLLEINGDDVIVQAADELLDRFALLTLHKHVAVRSAFSAEDTPSRSLAGFFKTILNVPHDDSIALINALIDVWRSAEAREASLDLEMGSFRRDILVMEMVDAKVAGVAFTEAEFEDDLVNYTDGTADALVSGEVAGSALTLPKLRAFESPTHDGGWQRRLQLLLRGVRRTFNLKGTDWDIEWADDGTDCWLLQVRPITARPRRNEAFTYANLREILPDPPSPYHTSVVYASSKGFFDYYRQFDKTLPQTRDMVEVFGGRPLFNLSLLTDMMRHWGLPSSLVTNSIGGGTDIEVGLKPLRFLSKSFVLLRMGWAQLMAVRSAQAAQKQVLALAASGDNTFEALSNTFVMLFTNFVTEMFNLTQAMSGPLLLMRLSGATIGGGESSVTTEMYRVFEQLKQTAREHGGDSAEFNRAFTTFLDNFGHRGIFESDIARPRYAEQQDELRQSIVSAAAVSVPPAASDNTSNTPVWLRPIEWQLERVLLAREQWRHHSMRCYTIVRDRFLTQIDAAVARGQLPAADAFWWLTHDDMAALDQGVVFSAEAIANRQSEHEALAEYDLPDLHYRYDPLLKAGEALSSDATLTGIILSTGVKTGRAWVLREPALTLPEGFNTVDTILIARSVDAGWIPTFSLVSGVAVEIGGDLSHGSILLREIGLPAITNVAGVTRAVATGDQVTLDASTGRILLI